MKNYICYTYATWDKLYNSKREESSQWVVSIINPDATIFMSVVNILALCEQGFSRSSERTCHNKLGWNSSKVTQEMLSSCRRCTTSCHENICSRSILLLSVSRHVCKYNWNGNKNVTFLKVDSCALSFYLLFFCFLVQVLFTFSNVQLYLLECLCGVCMLVIYFFGCIGACVFLWAMKNGKSHRQNCT